MYNPNSENKGADQLRGYREADLRLCFCLCRLLVFPCGGSNNCSIDGSLLFRLLVYVYCIIENCVFIVDRGSLLVSTSDSGSRGRGFEPNLRRPYCDPSQFKFSRNCNKL